MPLLECKFVDATATNRNRPLLDDE